LVEVPAQVEVLEEVSVVVQEEGLEVVLEVA